MRSTSAVMGANPRSFPRTRNFCRNSAHGEIIAPKDSSTRPRPSTMRGPTTDTSGCDSRIDTRRSTAPAVTIVSGLTKSTRSLDVLRTPRLLACAKPRLLSDAIRRTCGHRSRTYAGVESVDALSTTTISWATVGGGAVSDRRAFSRSLRGVVADDDDGESSHRVVRSTWSVRCAHSRHEYRWTCIVPRLRSAGFAPRQVKARARARARSGSGPAAAR